MKEIILAYQGEMTLKGLNRAKFEARLAKIIRWRLEPLGKFKVYQAQSTVFIEPKEDGLDMDEAFLAGLRQSGSTGESMYLGSLVNTFLDNFNCETVRVTVEGKSFSTAHADYDKPLQAFTF